MKKRENQNEGCSVGLEVELMTQGQEFPGTWLESSCKCACVCACVYSLALPL